MCAFADPDLGKSVEQLCAERLKRFEDVYAGRTPDRIPISLNLGYMIARLGGMTMGELARNPEKAQETLEKWALIFNADGASGGSWPPDFPSLYLGDKQTRWPGHNGYPDDRPFTFVEGEFMKAEEYDEFIDDPTMFTLRKFLPRCCTELEGLASIGPIGFTLMGYAAWSAFAGIGAPGIQKALEAMSKIAAGYAEYGAQAFAGMQRMEKLGFPMVGGFGALIMAPFDFLGDTLRGTRGIMRDMRKCPDKLFKAMDQARKIVLDQAITSYKLTGGTMVMIPLHKGSDGFMSFEQFETFYWPSFKQLMFDLIDAGLTPQPFYEGVWDSRLEYLTQFPAGKTRGMFERSNMEKVKEVVGDRMVITGGFPASLLQGGTVEQVREHTKWMCEKVGKGGGFVMGASTAMDYCDPELVKAWVLATKEFGTY